MDEQMIMAYDLAPLAWWQNPYYWLIATMLMIAVVGGGWLVLLFLYRRRVPRSWQGQMIQRLQKLQNSSYDQGELIELLRCIRDMAILEGYASYRPVVTDQEFLVDLIQKNKVPQELRFVITEITEEVVRIKFAQFSPDKERLTAQIKEILRYLNQSEHGAVRQDS